MSDAERAARYAAHDAFLDALWHREGVLLAFTDYREEIAPPRAGALHRELAQDLGLVRSGRLMVPLLCSGRRVA